MTNQEILTKAIQKAIDGGFDGTPYWTVGFTAQGAVKAIYEYRNPPYEQIIFNHRFAEALWGEQEFGYPPSNVKIYTPPNKGPKYVSKLGWKTHLQQMVIADHPIKYLGDNI